MSTYRCECGTRLELASLLDALPVHGAGASAMIGATCAGCGTHLELRLRDGRFEVGYSYFGGSMHFESMHTVSVPGLRVVPSEPDDLAVTLGERHWHFAVRAESHQRFIVFDRAVANGQRLDALDFSQFGVVVQAVERGDTRMDPSADLVLSGGDFLHLRGPAPALTRAWHYLNDGRDARG